MKDKIGSYITQLLDHFVHSFNGSKKGASAKKLTAFVIVNCVIVLHYKVYQLSDALFNSILLPLLAADFSFIALLFGIGTYEKKIDKSPTNDEL